MSGIIKVLATEKACNTTPNTFNDSKLVRLYNNSNTGILVTVSANSSVNVGTFTIGPWESTIVEKNSIHRLESANNSVVLGTPIAYKD